MTDIGRIIDHTFMLALVATGSGHPACAATAPDATRVGNPSWSPDGKWISFDLDSAKPQNITALKQPAQRCPSGQAGW